MTKDELESKTYISSDVAMFLNNGMKVKLVDFGVTNWTYRFNHSIQLIRKMDPMNRAQNRINNLVSEISFFKRLFKDAISKGFSIVMGLKWRPVQ